MPEVPAVKKVPGEPGKPGDPEVTTTSPSVVVALLGVLDPVQATPIPLVKNVHHRRSYRNILRYQVGMTLAFPSLTVNNF